MAESPGLPETTPEADSGTAAAVHRFLLRYLEDRAQGAEFDLEHYQALFPGHESAVAEKLRQLRQAEEEPEVARTIGRFEIVRELGRGGQAVVYLARDPDLHREVALKVLPSGVLGSPERLHRFQREAEAASRLDHPRICTVYEAGSAPGCNYIAMRYVAGETLAQRIASASEARPEEGGPRLPALADGGEPDLTVLLRFFEETARALHAAHEAGVIHRDVKPRNIMVTPEGKPVLLDFGLALAQDSDAPTLTRSGELFGTPAFMAPEQLRGSGAPIDRRSDVWALGATVYEGLTLRRPFEAPTREALYRRILEREPVDPHRLNPALSRDLGIVVQTALEKSPGRRYQSAAAFASDLAAVRQGRPIAARAPGRLGRLWRWSGREPAKAALLLVLLVALPAIAALVTSHVANLPDLERARRAAIHDRREEALFRGYHDLATGHQERAIPHFEAALHVDRESVEAAMGIAVSHHERYRDRDVLATLDTHAAILAGRPAATMLRAHALRRLGLLDMADEVAKGLTAARDASDLYMLGEFSMSLGHEGDESAYPEALRAYTDAIMLSGSPRLLYYAERAHAAGHVRDLPTLRSAVHALGELWPDDPAALRAQANALSIGGLVEEAIDVLREAMRREPERSEDHYHLGIYLGDAGDFDAARDAFREAIRLDPRCGEARTNLGICLKNQGLLDAAIVEFEGALEVQPYLCEALVNLASALSTKGRHEDALELARGAVERHPQRPMTHGTLAEVLMARGEDAAAIEVLDAAIRLGAAGASHHYLLGNALMHVGNPERAAEAFRESIRLSPGAVRARINLGNALRELGDLEGAIASYEEATRTGPEHPGGWCNLGLVLGETGRFKEALEAARQGHERDKDWPGWDWPSAEQVTDYERLVAVEEHCAAVIEGAADLPDSETFAEFIRICRLRNDHCAAARLFQILLAHNPALGEDPAKRHRFRGACSAALAGTSAGRDLTDGERAAWREQALAWLDADLTALREANDESRLRPTRVLRVLEGWLEDEALAGVRGAEALADLPAQEGVRWSRFWGEVEDLDEELR